MRRCLDTGLQVFLSASAPLFKLDYVPVSVSTSSWKLPLLHPIKDMGHKWVPRRRGSPFYGISNSTINWKWGVYDSWSAPPASPLLFDAMVLEPNKPPSLELDLSSLDSPWPLDFVPPTQRHAAMPPPPSVDVALCYLAPFFAPLFAFMLIFLSVRAVIYFIEPACGLAALLCASYVGRLVPQHTVVGDFRIASSSSVCPNCGSNGGWHLHWWWNGRRRLRCQSSCYWYRPRGSSCRRRHCCGAPTHSRGQWASNPRARAHARAQALACGIVWCPWARKPTETHHRNLLCCSAAARRLFLFCRASCAAVAIFIATSSFCEAGVRALAI